MSTCGSDPYVWHGLPPKQSAMRTEMPRRQAVGHPAEVNPEGKPARNSPRPGTVVGMRWMVGPFRSSPCHTKHASRCWCDIKTPVRRSPHSTRNQSCLAGIRFAGALLWQRLWLCGLRFRALARSRFQTALSGCSVEPESRRRRGRDPGRPRHGRGWRLERRDGLVRAGYALQEDADYFRRLDAVKQACERHRIEFIPAVFSMVTAAPRWRTTGIWPRDCRSRMPRLSRKGGRRRFVPDESVRWPTAGSRSSPATMQGIQFPRSARRNQFLRHARSNTADRPRCAWRIFTANPHGHGRVMQEVRVRPHRCYRVEPVGENGRLQPASGFQIPVLAGKRDAGAAHDFKLPDRRLAETHHAVQQSRLTTVRSTPASGAARRASSGSTIGRSRKSVR